MNNKLIKSVLIGTVALGASAAAVAVPVTFFDTIPAGHTQFDATVTGAGSSVANQNLSGLASGNSWAFTDFTITTTDGTNTSIYGPSADGSTGDMIRIDPQAPVAGSGITFTFNNAINALGFEIGDWGTCCHPSSLFIAFDGGSTQLVGTANSYNDNPAVAAGFNQDAFFIGAIDDTSTFTTVTFYGDGIGEVLTAGGTVKYAAVALDSIPGTPGTIPEPATLALFGLGLAGLGVSRRGKKA